MATATYITPTIIAKESIMKLEDKCPMINIVNRQYKTDFVKVGSFVTIDKPCKYTTHHSADVTDHINTPHEYSTTLAINQWSGVAFEVTQKDMTLSIKDFSKKHIDPAVDAIAADVDTALTALYKDIYGGVGTPGITPAAFSTFGDAAAKLTQQGCPDSNRRLVMNAKAGWSMADAMKGSFDPNLAADTVRRGKLGFYANTDIFQDEKLYRHTASTLTGTWVVDTNSDSVTYTTTQSNEYSTLMTDGITGTVSKGDTFTIAGVYAVNHSSKQAYPHLQQFTCIETCDTSASTATNVLVKVYPMIIASGAYQTVSAAPADGAALTLTASHTANLMFQENAFTFVTVPFDTVGSGMGVDMKTLNEDGIAITVSKAFSITQFVQIIRLDLMYGVKTLDPALAVRVYGE